MGKSNAPAAPDPVTTANAQGAADINTAIAQGVLNHTSQYGPQGSVVYNQTGTTDVNGNQVPSYSQTTSLTPQEQQIFNTQQGIQGGIANLGQQALGAVNTNPINYAGLPQVPGQQDLTNYANQQAQTAYNQGLQFLQPTMDHTTSLLENRLTNQGLPVNSEAYNQGLDQNNRSNDLTLSSLANQSILSGTQQASALQNQGINAQNQALNVATQQQNQPLNVLSALVQGGGSIQNPSYAPTTQTGVSPTDVLGAYGLQQSALQNAYQGNIAQQSGTIGGLASLGSTGALAYLALSDRRMKKNIKKISEVKGINIYEFEYLHTNGKRIGVMAQEVEHLPDVVFEINGTKFVNYTKLGEYHGNV